METIPIVELNFSAPETRAVPANCDDVIAELLSELSSAETEPEVAALVQTARGQGATLCSDEERQTLNQHIEEKTTHTFRAVVLSMGERLVVQVSRIDGEQTLVWKTTYTTGPRGRWLTTYGVGFLPEEDEEFFAESSETIDSRSGRRSRPADSTSCPRYSSPGFPAHGRTEAGRSAPRAGLGSTSRAPSSFSVAPPCSIRT